MSLLVPSPPIQPSSRLFQPLLENLSSLFPRQHHLLILPLQSPRLQLTLPVPHSLPHTGLILWPSQLLTTQPASRILQQLPNRTMAHHALSVFPLPHQLLRPLNHRLRLFHQLLHPFPMSHTLKPTIHSLPLSLKPLKRPLIPLQTPLRVSANQPPHFFHSLLNTPPLLHKLPYLSRHIQRVHPPQPRHLFLGNLLHPQRCHQPLDILNHTTLQHLNLLTSLLQHPSRFLSQSLQLLLTINLLSLLKNLFHLSLALFFPQHHRLFTCLW